MVKRNTIKISFFALLLFLFVALPALAGGLSDAWINAGHTADSAEYKDLGSDGLMSYVGTIIQTALGFLGVIFLILMIYGGFLWMTDRGNEDQVKKSKGLISAAVIGLIIVLSAYAISFFVVDALQKDTINPSTTTGSEGGVTLSNEYDPTQEAVF